MKKLLLIGAILITSTAGANIALANQEELVAEDKPPIVLQVEEHEVRLDEHDSDIDALENKTDNIQGQVDQNTNTVTEVRERVVVVEQKVEEKPKPQAPAPEPEPEPEIDPWTIVQVVSNPRYDGITGEQTGWTCKYYLEARVITNLMSSGVPCLDNNTILPTYLRLKSFAHYTKTW